MKQKFYNAWYVPGHEWTIHGLCNGRCTLTTEDVLNPKNLSFEDAKRLCRLLNDRFGTIDYEVRQITLSKIIPGIPLDATMHILQAGYIQDRARKKYRPSKI